MTSYFPKHQRMIMAGFTLTEMAVVLVIVALLIGGMLLPLTAQVDQRNTTETTKTMSEIREALLGFAAAHVASDGKPFLPCPDTDGDGDEDRISTPGPCAQAEGRLPWVDLGLGQDDAWNNRFRYRVTLAFANSNTGFNLTPPTSASLRACADAACAAIVANNLVVTIISHGKNGAGAFNANIPPGVNTAPTDANEIENTDNDNDLVTKTTDTGFDDLVAWLPASILFNRMVSAGRLP